MFLKATLITHTGLKKRGEREGAGMKGGRREGRESRGLGARKKVGRHDGTQCAHV